MSVYLIDHKKAGTTEFTVLARYVIPITDGRQYGTDGLEGFDEDSEWRGEFRSRVLARAWLTNVAKREPGRQWSYAEITQQEWVEDSWPDDEYGTVHDAVAESRHRWSYYWTGKWEADDDWDITDGW